MARESAAQLSRRDFTRGVAFATIAEALPAIAQDSSTVVKVRIDEKKPLGDLPAYGLGFSIEKNLIGRADFFTHGNTELAGCCRRLGKQVFRMGGDHVDHTLWDPRGGGGADGKTAPRDIVAFAEFVHAIGWKVIYGLNLANGTPQATAAEGKAAAAALGDALLAFEIGNEPNLYVFHKLRPEGYDYPQFLAEWVPHAKALQAAVPHAQISGPGAFNNGWRHFGLPFAKDLNRQVFMLTSHYYRANGTLPDASADSLLDDLPNLYEELRAMVAAARDNHIEGGFRMVETNTFFGGGSDGVSDTMVSALWAMEYALTAAELGVNGLNFQIGPRGHSNTSVAISPGHVNDVRPEFYGLAMLADLGQGTMLQTNLSDAPKRFTAHCVHNVKGFIDAVLINMNKLSASAEVQVGQAASGRTLLLTAKTLGANHGVTLGGSAIGPHGDGEAKWSPVAAKVAGNFIVTVPPASATCLRTQE